MSSLPELIPDVDYLLAMETEELAAALLPILANQRDSSGVHPHNFINSLFSFNIGGHRYVDSRQGEIELAVSEAWNWLEVQGLLIAASGVNGTHGWRVLSRRAQRFQSPDDIKKFSKSRSLSKDSLHPRIAEKVWSAFIRGEFDVAVFQAMKAVEVAVRDAAGLSPKHIGTALMRLAFAVDDGQLTDFAADKSERQARADLFAGAIGSYKNSHSHRDVNLDDPDEAREIVMLANHLLRIVDQRVAARSNSTAAPCVYRNPYPS
jgi:uncharacterized protein (TIGR02391 family)